MSALGDEVRVMALIDEGVRLNIIPQWEAPAMAAAVLKANERKGAAPKGARMDWTIHATHKANGRRYVGTTAQGWSEESAFLPGGFTPVREPLQVPGHAWSLLWR